MSTPPFRLFCFGLGFSSQALIRHLDPKDWQFDGTVRSAEKAGRLAGLNINAQVWNGGQIEAAMEQAIAAATHIVVSIPPDEDGDPAFNTARDLLVASKNLAWLGYLSTTGVYGDTDGAEVDETSPTNPSSARSQRRVDAERDWLSLWQNHGVPVHVFRLAGIYGPGRSTLDAVRAGRTRRINKPGHAFSRIHVDDIAQILAASIKNPNPGAIYNVCDDEAAAPADVTAFACELLDITPDPLTDFETAKREMSPMALSFWNDNRRVANRRIHEELGVELRYPTYREGLRAQLASERQ